MSTLLRPARAFPALLCVLALVCSGCQLRLQVDVDVNRDGGGVFSVSVAADEELLATAQDAGADPLGDLATTGEGLGAGWRVRDAADEAGGRTVTLSAPFGNAEQFADLTRQVSEALNADEVVLLEPMTLAVDGDVIRLDGAASAVPQAAVRDYGLSPKAVVRRVARADAFDYRVVVTMPGEVTSTTAARTEGSVLTWEVPPGERVEIAAAGVRPGPPIARALAGAAAGAVLAAALLWLASRRRRR